MEKNNPFKVPDNYFQVVKLEIIKNLPEKQKKLEKRNIFFTNVILKWSAFAAIVILLIFVGFEYIGDHNKYLVSKTKQVQEEKSPSTVDKQYASLQDDYYLFLEDQTAISIYREVLDSDDLLN